MRHAPEVEVAREDHDQMLRRSYSTDQRFVLSTVVGEVPVEGDRPYAEGESLDEPALPR